MELTKKQDVNFDKSKQLSFLSLKETDEGFELKKNLKLLKTA